LMPVLPVAWVEALVGQEEAGSRKYDAVFQAIPYAMAECRLTRPPPPWSPCEIGQSDKG